MSLTLEIEFLGGVCRATRGLSDDEPDWPVQLDRVFSALVSAWAARGERAEERAALEWLEIQEPPDIYASEHTARTTPDVFVPPNDFQSPTNILERQKWYRDFLVLGRRPPEKGGQRRLWQQALSTIPESRQRKDRRFPVAVPTDPIMLIIWPDEPAGGTFEALDAMVRDVGYIGHSASLVRCRFLLREISQQSRLERKPAKRRIYRGRLRELEAAHRANPVRPSIQPGVSVLPERSALSTASRSEWLVLEAVGGNLPDLRAAARICRLLRNTLMSGYRRNGIPDDIPEIVSGHAPDRTPTRLPHLAIAPMAFAGFPHADGTLFGFALIPPADTSLAGIPGFRAAFENVAPYNRGQERRILTLQGPPLDAPLRLAPAGAMAKRSLSPDPYLKPARVWASVTPVVLDRHLKKNDDAEIREVLARSCENAGLSRPDMDCIYCGKHSAVEGAPPARPPAGAPPWTRWRVPRQLASRSLVHTVVDFGEKIDGPVLLGAGRFTGLGLCRGLED